MTKSSKKTDPAPIMDVAHPGKSAPADTSRAIIPNRSVMKDPMVMTAATPASPKPEPEAEALPPTAKIHLHPDSTPSTPTAASEPDPTADEPLAPAVDEAAPSEKTPEIPATEPAAAATAESQAESTESVPPPPQAGDVSITQEPVEEPTADQPAKQSPPESADLEAKAASERAEYEAKLQVAYDSKQYFLPINTLEKRRSKHFVIMGVLLSLVLLLAWADIALDARLIHLGDVKPLTHFFSS